MLDLLVTASLALLAPTPASPPQAPAPQEVEASAAADREALERLAADLVSSEPKQRKRALTAAAELMLAHPDTPSVEVARVLAAGLEDEDYDVRATALKLLLRGQHPDATVVGIVEAIENLGDEWEALEKELRKSYEHAYEKKGMGSSLGMNEMLQVPTYWRSLLESAGRLPDDRVEEALLDVLDLKLSRAPGVLLAGAAVGALRLGTKGSVGAVVDLLKDYQKATRKKPLERRFPKVAGGTLGSVLYVGFEVMGGEGQRRVERELESRARELDLLPWEGLGVKDLTRWWKKHSSSLPKKLGALTTPVVVELDDEA